jgi:hypothetical protein
VKLGLKSLVIKKKKNPYERMFMADVEKEGMNDAQMEAFRRFFNDLEQKEIDSKNFALYENKLNRNYDKETQNKNK